MNGDLGLCLLIAVLVVFCSGDPDLIDALVKHFMVVCPK
jgi:hypothetical protein